MHLREQWSKTNPPPPPTTNSIQTRLQTLPLLFTHTQIPSELLVAEWLSTFIAFCFHSLFFFLPLGQLEIQTGTAHTVADFHFNIDLIEAANLLSFLRHRLVRSAELIVSIYKNTWASFLGTTALNGQETKPLVPKRKLNILVEEFQFIELHNGDLKMAFYSIIIKWNLNLAIMRCVMSPRAKALTDGSMNPDSAFPSQACGPSSSSCSTTHECELS